MPGADPALPLLAGRRRELELLHSQLRVAASGRSRVVLVAGEPGIGKTHLLDALADGAGPAVVLRGGATEAEGMPPYLPFVEALGSHVLGPGAAELRDRAADLAQALAPILPELAVGAAPGPSLPAEHARLRLFEAVSDLLGLIGGGVPVVLVLDDLQWADPASLDLLRHLARRRRQLPLLVAGAYREGDAAVNEAFSRALEELNRRRVLEVVRLGALPPAAVALLAERHLGGPLDEDAVRVLATHSEGNPFFAEELLRGWRESGVLLVADSVWRLRTPDPPSLPSTIALAIGQRLARLPDQVVDLLRIAAIVGRTFEVAPLAEVAGREPELVEDGIQVAARAGLVATSGEGAFAFAHDRVRECLYEQVGHVRRRTLHGLIGRALERTHGEGGRGAAEVAFHYGRSADRQLAVASALRAGEQALAAFAGADARAHFQVGLAALPPGDERHGRLLLGLGEAAQLAGAEHDAEAAYAEAETWCLGAQRREDAALAAHRLGRARWRQESLEAAREAFERAAGLLGDRPDRAAVEVLVDLASLLGVSLHRYAEGLAHARRALEAAEAVGDEGLLAAATRTTGNLLVRTNDPEAGIPLLERALVLATADDDPVEAAECCACLAMAYLWLPDMERARRSLRQQVELARRCHDQYQLRHVHTMLAVVALVQGDRDEGERLLREAEDAVQELASPEPRAYLLFVRAAQAYFQGEHVRAHAGMEQMIAALRGSGPHGLVWHLGWLGLTLAAQERRDEAASVLRELEDLLRDLPAGSTVAGAVLVLGTQVALAIDDERWLSACAAPLTAYAPRWLDALGDRVLGELHLRHGEWELARRHLDAADAVARRERMRWELARTLVARAMLERAAPDPAGPPGALLEEAVELFRSVGDGDAARRARELLAAGEGAAALPAGLTRREVEVLRLVATGESNRTIARRLFLSESTVAHHLTAIYGKTRTENRAGATAFAIRHGLA